MEINLLLSNSLSKLQEERKVLEMQLNNIDIKIASCIKFYSFIIPGVSPGLSVPEEHYEEAIQNKEHLIGMSYEIFLRDLRYTDSSGECVECGNSSNLSVKGMFICSNDCAYKYHVGTFDGSITKEEYYS